MSTKPNKTRVAAYGLITKDEQILLCRISAQLPHLHGQWTLPGGGIEFGETPQAAVVREVEEETGLIVAVGQLEHVDSVVVETDDTVFHSVRILYRVSYVSGELRNELNGTTDLCQWWSSSELPDMVDLARMGADIVLPVPT